MEKDELYYRSLLIGFIANTLTSMESGELLTFIEAEPELYHELMNSPEVLEELEAQSSNPKIIIEAATRDRMKTRLMTAVQKPVRMIPWRSWVAAASIILIVGIGFWFYNQRSTSGVQPTTAKTQDITAPQSTRARITLGDGTIISLDSVNAGLLAKQAGGTVSKTADGKIVYQQTTASDQSAFNTLSNPRGSRVIDMTLSDGSHVWLNAGSSITFPVAFNGSERKVSMVGEAYFEVAKNASMPFKVAAGAGEVTVLGTHFNVNAYEDEENIKVTLLEGAVKLSTNNAQRPTILKPGQQGIITDNSELITYNSPDLAEVMAWKNGNFKFNNADIQTILRQVARWYDLEVVYEHTIPSGHYRGTVPRDVSAQKMLEIIKTSGVNFRIEAKKLIIE
jgi:transmembrane sensor